MEFDFPGVETRTRKTYMTVAHIKEQILSEANSLVARSFHLPMFFSFYPGKARVFYLVDRQGNMRFDEGVRAFQLMTQKYRPYRIALITEGILGSIPMDHPAPEKAVVQPYPVLNLLIQDRTQSHFSTHLIRFNEDGTRRVDGPIYDSDVMQPQQPLQLQVSFFPELSCCDGTPQ